MILFHFKMVWHRIRPSDSFGKPWSHVSPLARYTTSYWGEVSLPVDLCWIWRTLPGCIGMCFPSPPHPPGRTLHPWCRTARFVRSSDYAYRARSQLGWNCDARCSHARTSRACLRSGESGWRIGRVWTLGPSRWTRRVRDVPRPGLRLGGERVTSVEPRTCQIPAARQTCLGNRSAPQTLLQYQRHVCGCVFMMSANTHCRSVAVMLMYQISNCIESVVLWKTAVNI